MFKKIICLGLAGSLCVGIAISKPPAIILGEERANYLTKSISSLENIGFNQITEGYRIESSDGADFLIYSSLTGTKRDLEKFDTEVRDASQYISDELFEKEILTDCARENIHPSSTDGTLHFVGTDLADLRDPNMMTHRERTDVISEYPSDLVYDMSGLAFVFVCIDCPEIERRSAIVREMMYYWSDQCSVDENEIQDLVNKIENDFIESRENISN